ncbi:hypothetical protein [Bacillus haynesii]
MTINNTAYMDLSVLAHAFGSSLKRAAYIKALAQVLNGSFHRTENGAVRR